MEKPSSSPSPNTGSDPKLQIEQNVEGDRNQTIGQVLGGMVVYGNVIYNTPLTEADSSTSQTKDPKIGANPYKGLLAFQETDGDRFFGRDPQINELWEKFRSLHEQESATRLLTIYGPSGSGKSSLARAGLIPKLARKPLPGGDRARVAVLVPGSHPLESLATVMARIATNDPTPVTKTREFATELSQANAEGVYDGLRRIADALPEIVISPLIVLVDQLEEVFTLCEDPKERDAFIGNLLCAVADQSKRVSAIFTLRSDFLGATQKYPLLNQAIAAQGYLVAAMSEDGLREAIAKPAELAGHPLDLSTINLLIEQTADREGALPLLQFALAQIWMGLEVGKEPAETLRAIDGVGGALAGEAQRIYESLTLEEQEIARRVFLGLVQLGEGAKDTRRRTKLERVVAHRDSLEHVQKVIDRFASPGTRLITLGNDEGVETAEVTHEALFDNWQQLKNWLDSGRSDLRFQRRLDEAVTIWQENGRPEGNLWRSPDLDFLIRYQLSIGDDMTPRELEFFNASINSVKAQKQAEEKAAQEKKRLRRIFSRSIIVALVVTSGVAILALAMTQQVQRQRVEQLAINAELLTGSQPVDAVIAAIAAKSLSESFFVKFPDHPQFPEVEVSLIDAIEKNREQNRIRLKDQVHSVNFSPDNQRIVSGNDDHTLQIWNTNTEKSISETLTGHTGAVNSVAFSSDSQHIVSGSNDKTVRIWDAKTGKSVLEPLTDHTEEVMSVAFSFDGQYIVSGSKDKTIRIWDAKTGKPVVEPFKHDDEVYSVAFSRDGQHIVSGSKDKTIRIWDVKTGKQPIGSPLLGHDEEVNSVAFSHDGKRIVSGSKDKTVRIWDWDTKKGKPIGSPLIGHKDEVYSVAFSRDSKRIVSSSADMTVLIWDVKETNEERKPPLLLLGHEAEIQSVAFSDDGKRIVSGSLDKTVRIWDANAVSSISQSLPGHSGIIYSVAFSNDGKHIVSGSEDKTVRIWDVNTGKSIGQPFEGHQGAVLSVAFSHDGKHIVSGSLDKTVQIWDARTRELVAKPINYNSEVNSVAFSPDSKHIISGSKDKTVRIWDAKTGEKIGEPLEGHLNNVNSVAFSHQDGRYIVSGSEDKTIQVWDAKTGGKIGEPLKDPKNGVMSVAFSPNNQLIVSGDDNYMVRIWNAKTRKQIGEPLKGHKDSVHSVAFSPNNNRIISGGSLDMMIQIWDAQTRKPIGKSLRGDKSSVRSVAYSPLNGKLIVSGGGDQMVRIWDFSLPHLLSVACKQLRDHPRLSEKTSVASGTEEAKKACKQYQ
jgi:WD40 repeat protein